MAVLRLRDGRLLQFCVYGAASFSSPSMPCTATILYFHGWPSSQHEACLLEAPAAAAGLRVISCSRPGVGLSTLDPGERAPEVPAGPIVAGFFNSHVCCMARPDQT